MPSNQGSSEAWRAVPSGLDEADIGLLLNLPLFSGLRRAELFHLIADSRVERRAAGSLLFLDGDPARYFYAVLEGLVKLYRSTPDGGESVIAVLPRGESFAEAAVFEEATYPVSSAAVEDARLLVIPAHPFVERMLGDRRLALKMFASMARRLRQLVHQVEELSLKTTLQRLAAYLANLCEAPDGPAVVRLPIEKTLIARHLGMQPETLSRCFARLKASGVVAEGDRVRIADVARLRRLAGVAPGQDES